ncbi:hypothetical protein RRG08_031595 [Elysia crispata]|uniref:Uncharacterized protein n=1 Tax=Elysia crispata TaxID=231223 RepID=A0AAE1E8T1_9GAST|nr:hypothetical protein RRG08_031595 [Elysia crispata]
MRFNISICCEYRWRDLAGKPRYATERVAFRTVVIVGINWPSCVNFSAIFYKQKKENFHLWNFSETELSVDCTRDPSVLLRGP